MSNLFYLAQGGLNSAQAALSVTGNNMSNAYTQGYSRQNIMLGEAGGKTTAYGFFGYGVQVNDVRRSYDSFISAQYRDAASGLNFLGGRANQLSQIDNLFGDDTNNISVSMDSMFDSMEKISADPSDEAARQETLAQFRALTNQYQSNSKALNGLEKSTNTQIVNSVKDINSATDQLAKLNAEIEKIHGQTGGVPADLLDQRDLLLDQLNEQVGIKVDEDPITGTVNVSMAGGMPLVSGDKSYKLASSQSPEDPATTIVSYVDASGNSIQMDEDKITSGKLGGLFKFRNVDLVDARNQLNQLALQTANAFNEVNVQGVDRNGNPGVNLFDIDNPVALANQKNAGDASFNVNYSSVPDVQAQDYTVTYKSGNWEVTRADGYSVPVTVGGSGELQFDGITMTPQGTPQDGDSFKMNPVSGAADSIHVAITDGDQIAAGKTKDAGDHDNITDLIALKDKKLVGNATLTEAYASLVSSVGSSMSEVNDSLQTSAKTTEAAIQQRQSVSGVSVEEEYVNLQMFQQFYQANAQVLQTATTLFDTILSIK